MSVLFRFYLRVRGVPASVECLLCCRFTTRVVVPAMQLKTLLEDLPGIQNVPASLGDLDITGVTADPNLCRPGFLYLAAESETVDSTRFGTRLDGREFIEAALNRGALAVVTTPEVSLPAKFEGKVALVKHDTPLLLLGYISSRFFGEPRPQHVALITGTNGKTSTVNFCRMLWTAAGLKSCSVGNLGGVCSDGTLVWDRDPTLSVPETVYLHRMLHEIAARGFDYVAMETTSHALFDYRLHGVQSKIGAFTNLTRDHLDFHHNMEEYFRVKMTLFTEVLPPGSFAILCADGDWYERAHKICEERGHRVISYGWKGADIQLKQTQRNEHGQLLTLDVMGRRCETQLRLMGDFQVSNVLCSLGVMIASGTPAEEAVKLIGFLEPVEGRLNTVATTPTGGRVVVDYAHSPDAIRAALEACRSFTDGKLVIVFGANGERDPGKRGQMGEMASNHADVVIITDGQPRTEEPSGIRKQVLEGAPNAKEIADRASAIEYGIKLLGRDDTLLIAGMGHETHQVIGEKRIPFSDSEVARKIVGTLEGTMYR